jgi:hypothetical protein
MEDNPDGTEGRASSPAMYLPMSNWGWNSAIDLWVGFAAWNPVADVYYAIIAVSLFSALILQRFIGGLPMVTLPASFAILAYCARLSNYLASGIELAAVGDFQKAAAFSIIGHLAGGLLLLAIFGVREVPKGSRL